jgi:hypothetical protein
MCSPTQSLSALIKRAAVSDDDHLRGGKCFNLPTKDFVSKGKDFRRPFLCPSPPSARSATWRAKHARPENWMGCGSSHNRPQLYALVHYFAEH